MRLIRPLTEINLFKEKQITYNKYMCPTVIGTPGYYCEHNISEACFLYKLYNFFKGSQYL